MVKVFQIIHNGSRKKPPWNVSTGKKPASYQVPYLAFGKYLDFESVEVEIHTRQIAPGHLQMTRTTKLWGDSDPADHCHLKSKHRDKFLFAQD